jgi:hypothetical protein
VPEKTVTTGCPRGIECFARVATRKETIYRSQKYPLMRQNEHIGKQWSEKFIGELRKGFESTTLKI